MLQSPAYIIRAWTRGLLRYLSPNGFALTTPLNRTRRALLPGGAVHPVKGCGCCPCPRVMASATQGTHAPCPSPTCRSVRALLDDA